MREHPYALTLFQGKRLRKVWRWPQRVKIYKPITAIPQKTPLRVTAVGHGLPDGWPVTFAGVRGPGAINDRWFQAKVIDLDTIEINLLNAAALPDYAGGGHVEYFQPVDLTGYSGVAMLKADVADPSPVLEISTANNRMVLDNVGKTITFDVDGATIAAIDVLAGVWDWEMTAGGVTVSPLGQNPLPPWRLIREGVK